MFFKKRREEKQQQRAAAVQVAEQARIDTVKQFGVQLDAALKIADPVERCLGLMDVSDSAGKIRKACEEDIRKKADKKKGLPEASLTITGIGVGIVFGPLVFITTPVGYCCGASIGEKRAAKETARLRDIDKTLLEGMAGIVDKAEAAAKTVLTIDPRQLSGSPKADDLMQRVPKLKEDMLEAFRKNPTAPSLDPKPKPGGFRL